MDKEEFLRQVEGVKSDVVSAMFSFDVHEALFSQPESEAEEAAAVLNYYSCFPTIQVALYNELILGLARVFDKYSGTMSLVNLLKIAQRDMADLTPHLSSTDIVQMEHDIDQYSPLLNDVKTVRDKYKSHSDSIRPSSPPLSKAELEGLFDTVIACLSRLSKTNYIVDSTRDRLRRGTNRMFDDLRQDWIERESEYRNTLAELENPDSSE